MGEQREVRVAVTGDLHFDGRSRGSLRDLFAEICREANIVALCGDLTTHGEEEQIRGFIDELEGVDIPIVTVLGNHDYEGGKAAEFCSILKDRGVHVLDGDSVEIDGVGFAGIKGFGGGFGRRTLGPFGEQIYKDFVQTAIEESLKLETALRTLNSDVRVALLHYSPIRETLVGEPEEIYPWLGTSRLLQPIETYRPDAVFHGHAHIGTLEAQTPAGIPVYNVAASLLQERTGSRYRLWTARAPERRRRSDREGEGDSNGEQDS